ncbi:GDSL esterase/lipase [Vigna angularis]|uniref:GDSL esterase/lipase n=2 Tax=Phaseolus angularis TaxID=3914 RepID=A0A8T0K7E8_PHAAN|nr:GDSL esterase/lipase [Vigna angularis]BAT87774.1 hypothetical protein VIGAN_05117600 [Vigna angularis var. angularis]
MSFLMGIFLIGRVTFGIMFRAFMLSLLFRFGFSNDVPASFVFGDSLVDVGNNNYIVSLAKANHDPFGIDFGMPTGRFSNGKTVVDVINQKLGLDFSPPYLAPSTTGSTVLKGVNYASGAGGILNNSGEIFGGRINFDAQIDNFANTREEIISLIGAPEALNLFKKALFTVALGSNDFLDNYLTPLFSIPERLLVSPESFVATLISRLRLQLTVILLKKKALFQSCFYFVS